MQTIVHDPPEIEYLNGRAYPKVSPMRIHALVQTAAVRLLEDAAEARGQVGTEWRFRPGILDGTQTEFVPDVAFVSFGRLRPLSPPDREMPPFAPDIAIEVRSPSLQKTFLRLKIEKYLSAGTILVLDIDPERRIAVAHDKSGTREYANDATFEHEAVPWLTFQVAKLFAKIDL